MSQISWVLSHLNWTEAIDLALVALIIYGVLRLIEGTRAVQLLRGIIFLLVAAGLISVFSPFPVLNWIIRTAMPAMVVAIPVIFQPELRRGLERLGRAPRLVNASLASQRTPGLARTVNEIISAMERMSDRRYGALIALEATTGLEDFADTGTLLEATVSADLLVSIFFPGSPLHDGAVIVHDNRIHAARCVFPLSENPALLGLGTRHRAALSVAEQTDAVCFVVSEETGAMSLAMNGKLYRGLDRAGIERLIRERFGQLRVRSHRFRHTPARLPEKTPLQAGSGGREA